MNLNLLFWLTIGSATMATGDEILGYWDNWRECPDNQAHEMTGGNGTTIVFAEGGRGFRLNHGAKGWVSTTCTDWKRGAYKLKGDKACQHTGKSLKCLRFD